MAEVMVLEGTNSHLSARYAGSVYAEVMSTADGECRLVTLLGVTV